MCASVFMLDGFSLKTNTNINGKCVSYKLLTWQPNLKKTPSGGRMIASMMSMQFNVPSDGIFSSLDYFTLSKWIRILVWNALWCKDVS